MLRILENFPRAWYGESEPLPVSICRRGVFDDLNVIYQSRYLMAGGYRVSEIINIGLPDIWIEHIIPWPWFLLITAIPRDYDKILDNPDSILPNYVIEPNFYYLLYVDSNGALPFRIKEKFKDTLFLGFKTLWDQGFTPCAPDLHREAWDEITNRELGKKFRRGVVVNATEITQKYFKVK